MRIPRLSPVAWCGVAGGGILFVWAAAVLIFAAPAWLAWALLLLGIALAGTYIWFERAAVTRVLLSPQMRYGSNALAFAGGVAAIVVMLNVLTTRHSLRLDLTVNRFFSLSDQTRKVLKALDRKVKFTAFFKSGSPEAGQLADLLSEYRHYSKQVEFEFIDPDKTPARAQIYKVSSINTTVVESGDKRKDIQAHEIFGYTFQGQQPQQEFKGEGAITSALISVTSEGQQTICFLEGHGERSTEDGGENGMAEVKRLLEGDNFIVKPLNLMRTGKVPEDAGLIVIAGPRGGIAKSEQVILSRYLKGAGRLLVMMDPESSGGLESVLASWGVKVLGGVAIDPRSYYFVDPLTPIPSYGSHPIVADLQKQRVGTLFPGSRAIEAGTLKGGTVTPLMKTTPESWLEGDMAGGRPKFNPKLDRKGPLILAVAVSLESAPPAPEKGEEPAPPTPPGEVPKLVVFADSDFASNKIRGLSDGNFDLFLNSASWLLGSAHAVSIRPKQPDQRRMFLTNVKANLIGYTTILLVPLAVIGIGVWRWWRRRRL